MKILNMPGEDKLRFMDEIDSMREKYVERAVKLTNSFCVSFYALLSEFSAIDAEEGFCSMFSRSNVLKKYMKYMDSERKRRFFNVMAMHHTIQMLAKKRDKLNYYVVSICLYEVYDFAENEKKLFDILYKCRMEFPKQFPDFFSKAAIKYMFGRDDDNIFAIAFFENFCYNSFKTFVKYFSEYISINRRIKISEMNEAAGA
ncbi:hypothetical protein MUJ63_04020 [Lachnospiraceae bacterium NSJ-143]|nr:hypothetical protein [Lachnospiraceae bacterium NSJ-143]